MRENLRKKINLLTRIQCYDHYKTRDMIYGIGYRYEASHYLDHTSNGYYYAEHNGYLWDVVSAGDEGDNKFASYEEAEDYLEHLLDYEFAKEYEFQYNYYTREKKLEEEDDDFGWGYVPNDGIGSLEDLEKIEKIWDSLKK